MKAAHELHGGGEVDTETILGSTQSMKQARRLVDEMAIQGGWQPTGYTDDNSVVYERQTEGGVERLRVDKKGERQYLIIKTVSQKGN